MNNLELVQRHDQKLETLRCPNCKRGIQVEERNCSVGYIQYKCTNCGYVEPYSNKSNRTILEMWKEEK